MSARHPDRDSGVQVSMALIALASMIVPAQVRPDWRREWEAEVWHHWDRVLKWAVVDSRARLRLWRACFGAFADAVCIRSHAAGQSILLDDVRRGVRMLAEGPRAAVGAVLMLALGLGVSSILLNLTIPELLRAPGVAAPDRLVMVQNTCSTAERTSLPVSAPEYEIYRGQSNVFEDAAAYFVNSGVVTLAGASGPARIATVSPNFFGVLGIRPLVGDITEIGSESEAPSRTAVLGYEFWRTRFRCDPSVVGCEVSVGGEHVTVVAVMCPDFDLPVATDLWCLRSPGETPQAAGGADARFLNVVGRLKPGVSIDLAQREMSELVGRLKPADVTDASSQRWGISLVPYESVRTGPAFAVVAVLLGCAAIVLVLASSSAAGRLVDGPNPQCDIRRSIVRRHLTRGIFIALIGAGFGLVAAAGTLYWLGSATAKLVSVTSGGLDGRVALLVAALAIASGLAVGLATSSLREFSRRVLTTVQFTLAFALALGCLAIVANVASLRVVKPGFETSGRLTYRLAFDASADPGNSSDDAIERARRLAGVEEAGAIDILPLDGGSSDRSLVVEGASQRIYADHECRSVSPTYFDVMNIPVSAGRTFRDTDRPGAPEVAIVNEAFARRYWPSEPAVGRRVRISTPRGAAWRTVVGVVGNVRQNELDNEPRPEVFLPLPQLPARSIAVVIRTMDGALPSISTDLASVEGQRLASSLRRLDDVVARTVAPKIALAFVVALCAAVALVLAAPDALRHFRRRVAI